jgi:methyltransferase family protein
VLLKALREIIGGWQPRAEAELLRLAREHLEHSRHGEALAVLSGLLEHQPGSVDALALAAEAAYLGGDSPLALRYCARLRSMAAGLPSADILQAQIRFGGEHYLHILARILEALRPRTYLEIGVEHGNSLWLVKAPTLAIGIDPHPKLAAPLAANQKVFAETSDAFFATHDLRAELGGLPIDLAFIDGMHHFEFALRDFANLEPYATPDSLILIHDCYPLDRETAERERQRDFWSGDIWRLVVLLKKYRPDLSIHTIGTAPTGLALVRNLDPQSRVLAERYEALREEFLALDYSYLQDDMPGKLNLFPNDWARIQTLLRPRAAAG